MFYRLPLNPECLNLVIIYIRIKVYLIVLGSDFYKDLVKTFSETRFQSENISLLVVDVMSVTTDLAN